VAKEKKEGKAYLAIAPSKGMEELVEREKEERKE